MNNKGILEMLKIKEECITKCILIINIQLTMIGLAKSNKITVEEFRNIHDKLEECKTTFTEIKIACDNTIQQYLSA